MSPCDDIGLHIDEVGDKRYEFMQLANTLVNNGTPDALMPENTYFSYLLSARTYKESFYEGSVLDAFLIGMIMLIFRCLVKSQHLSL